MKLGTGSFLDFFRASLAGGLGQRRINRAQLLRLNLGVPVTDVYYNARPKTVAVRARRAKNRAARRARKAAK